MYLQKIQSIKIGDIEIGSKTKQLQDLFALEPLYNLVLRIRRHLRTDILILVDELDQGWDNSEHSNRFLAGLVQAAVQIQNLGLQVHVIVFVRSELFDLVRSRLAQLDKIRTSIERLRWSDGELMNLVVKRIEHHFGRVMGAYEPREVLASLFDTVNRQPGFEYVISRTTRRPREVLQYTRLAHQYAVEYGLNTVSSAAILRAEEEFSTWKLEHVCAEYIHMYHGLEGLLRSFRGKQKYLTRSEVEQVTFDFIEAENFQVSWLGEIEDGIRLLYQIEFLGVRDEVRSVSEENRLEEYEFAYSLGSPNLEVASRFIIHPAFWKALQLVG